MWLIYAIRDLKAQCSQDSRVLLAPGSLFPGHARGSVVLWGANKTARIGSSGRAALHVRRSL